MISAVASNRIELIRPYVQIARMDHWFKNVFMLLGIVLAIFYQPHLFTFGSVPTLLLAAIATCIVASSNYVLNELLDAPMDRLHPTKKQRPAACGLISSRIALREWLGLGAIGVGIGFLVNVPFGLSALLLWVMGCIYNIPPVRAKDLPYVDVLTESINNPIRLLLGWYALIPDHLPPVSLILFYWMLGAFYMASKRFAEYRQVADPELLARCRSSFKHYDENRLLVSMLFYIATCSFFGGIFIVRYKLELILGVPAVAGFFAYYLLLALRKDSPVQNPEKLHHQRGWMAYTGGCALLFVVLMFVEIPILYDWFRVEAAGLDPLWRIGG